MTTVRLSCNDFAWPVLSHRTVLAVVADLGFEGIDIGLFHEATHVTVSSVMSGAKERAAQVLDDVDAAGLVVADVFLTSHPDLHRLTPTSREAGDPEALTDIFAATVDFAMAVGASGVTLLPGVVADGQSVSDAIGLAAEVLAPLVALGTDAGLRVSIEPHVGSCVESPEATLQLLERCPNLRLTLDPSHFIFQGMPTKAILPLVPHTGHVQIRPAGPGIMQSRVPDDQVDLATVVGALVRHGYDGWIASEYVWMEKWRCDEVDNTAESARLRVRLRELLDEATS